MQTNDTGSAYSHNRERVPSLRSRISLSKNRSSKEAIGESENGKGVLNIRSVRGHERNESASKTSIPVQDEKEQSLPSVPTPKSEKPLPSIQNEENPLQTHSSRLITFFVCGSVAIILTTKCLHWTAAVLLAVTLAYVQQRQIAIAIDDSEWTRKEQVRERQKVESAYNQETVEWMNGILKAVWPLINQDYFVPFIDLLEDALMQQVPGIVHSCRVEDLDQGTVPLRVQSFTLLDPSPYAFIGDNAQTPTKEKHNENSDEVNEQIQEGSEKPLDVGEYINLEVTFAYRSPATRRQRAKSNKQEGVMSDSDREQLMNSHDADLPVDQIHMLIYMAIGLQKIAAVEVPVWCEVLGIEGRMRIRIQLVPTAPFIGHVAFTFIDKPKLEISAKPLGRRMVIDAMHLPLISTYVLHSVEAVVKDFITPKSYTVDVASLLEVQDGPRNVYSLGVIILVLHQAADLPASDANGLSDPFVSVSFARAGRRIFTTRVLLRTRDPIWQEVAILLVSPDEARDHERLRMTVYDADRFSIDDPLGKVEVSIDKLIHRCLRQHNDPHASSLLETQTENLQPMRSGQNTSGRLSYSVGFFRLSTPLQGGRTASKVRMLQEAADRHMDTPPNASSDSVERSLPVLPEESGSKNGRQTPDEDDPSLSEYMTGFDRFIKKIGLPIDADVLRKRMERKSRIHKLTAMMEGEAQATIGPPDKQWPSGILCFHIHSIADLGFDGPQKSWTNSKRLAQKPQYAADEDVLGEGTSRMPNSYVQVLLNDEPIFRTRTKTLNPQPFINAGTERFVCDFNTARIDFVVRDSRQREHDAILGIASLKLDDTLVDTCRSTRWYTLSAGLGYGRIRISLLWRSCEIQLPAQLRGCNVGVVEIASCSVRGISAEQKEMFEKRAAHLMFETVGGRAETENVEPRLEYQSSGDENPSSEAQTIGFRWSLDAPVRIAVRQRYPNFLYVHLRSDSRVPGRNHKHAHTVIPMNRLEDNKITHKSVPLFETNDWQHFEQNLLRDMSTGDQLVSAKESEKKKVAILEQMVKDVQSQEYGKGARNGRQSSDSKDIAPLNCVGYLDVDLVIHAGLGPEHEDLLGGDHELRVAYDAFQALIDSGQRSRPKMLTPALRRKLSARVDRRRSALDSIDLGNQQGRSSLGSGRPSSARVEKDVDRIRDGVEDEGEGEDDDNDDDEMFGEDEDDDDDDDDDGTLMVAGEEAGLRARRRSMHRQQQGAAQVKTFRTLRWIKTNTEDGVGRMKRLASRQQNKRIAKMESEGISHF